MGRTALVLADEQSLVQVFSNLISNAIKYNKPGGSVIVTLREEDGTLVADVTDTGIGISREHLPLVFDQFYRVSRREDQKTKGTGLGLAIAKKIVEAHNGIIQVESEPERGSTFSVRLPKAEPEGK
jgi:signal transduction histidine kinase